MTHHVFEERAARERDAKLFRSLDGATATRLIKEDPAEYQRLKAADRYNDPGPQSGVRPGLVIKHYEQTPGEPLSDQELSLMLKYPKTEVEKFYAKSVDHRSPDYTHILAKKPSHDPSAVNGFVPRSEDEQLEIRNAAVLHGIIQGVVRFRTPEAKSVIADDQRINAGELGRLAGLGPDARVTVGQYVTLQEAESRRLAARTPAEVAQDHAASLRIAADKAQADAAEVAAKDE